MKKFILLFVAIVQIHLCFIIPAFAAEENIGGEYIAIENLDIEVSEISVSAAGPYQDHFGFSYDTKTKNEIQTILHIFKTLPLRTRDITYIATDTSDSNTVIFDSEGNKRTLFVNGGYYLFDSENEYQYSYLSDVNINGRLYDTIETIKANSFTEDEDIYAFSNWASEYILKAAQSGIISEYNEINFKRGISKVEVSEIVVSLIFPEYKPKYDVKSEQINGSLRYCVEKGFFSGDNPYQTIKRTEFFDALQKILKHLKHDISTDYEIKYIDKSDIDENVLPIVSYLTEKGVLTGYEDGSLRPQNALTKEEMIAIMARLFEIL